MSMIEDIKRNQGKSACATPCAPNSPCPCHMEAALLAAEELAKRVQMQQDGAPMRPDFIPEALAAYRAATGGAA